MSACKCKPDAIVFGCPAHDWLTGGASELDESSAAWTQDQVENLLAENDGLRAERDYYRRRWIMHGIRWPMFGQSRGWPSKALDALKRAQREES